MVVSATGRRSVDIVLIMPEFDLAVNTARIRMISSESQRLNHASTYERTLLKRLEEETVGACGEIAVAKHLDGWFVPGVNTFHKVADCMKNIEVRSTTIATGCLIVRDNDDNGRKYILAIVASPSVKLIGWMYGKNAKVDKFKRDPGSRRQAWFVPQDQLYSMNEFLKDATEEEF